MLGMLGMLGASVSSPKLPSRRSDVMPVNVPDFLADTLHLTREEVGAYTFLLMQEWMRGPLPNEIDKLAVVTREKSGNARSIPKKPEKIRNARSITLALLKEFFSLGNDGHWRQKRLEIEKEKVMARAAVDHARAVKAAATRWKGHTATWPKKKPKKGNARSNPLASLSIPTEKPVSSRARIYDARAEGSKNLKANTKAKAKPLTPQPRKNHEVAKHAHTKISRHLAASRKPAGRSAAAPGKLPEPGKIPSPNLRGNGEIQPGDKKPAGGSARGGNGGVGAKSRREKLVKTVKRFTVRGNKLQNGEKTAGNDRGAKREAKAKGAGFLDARFEPFQKEVLRYWSEQNPDTPKYWWGKRESAVLRELLKSGPDLQLSVFKRCLQNRAQSDVNPADLPHTWLRDVLRFAAGPLDRYGKPLRVH